jgi:hypothetical protein
MPRVIHTVRHERSLFNKIGFAQAYWLSSGGTATTPRIKAGRTGYIGGWASDGSRTVTAESATNVAVVKVPGTFMAQNRTGE